MGLLKEHDASARWADRRLKFSTFLLFLASSGIRGGRFLGALLRSGFALTLALTLALALGCCCRCGFGCCRIFFLGLGHHA